jgi:predicted nuclease of predicted toxin-antitoxin system
MAGVIRFHLDEHVDPAIAAALRRRGIDVTTTVEVSLLSSPDESHLDHALDEGRVIVTHDSDFLRIDRLGTSHPGVAYCQQGERSIGQIVEMLELIWEVYSPDDMQNRVEFL